MKARKHGLTGCNWCLFATMFTVLALGSAYAGHDDVMRNQVAAANKAQILFAHCLNGNVIERSRPGCEPLAQYIIAQANQGEKQ